MAVFRTPQVILFSGNVSRAVTFYLGLGFVETFRVPAEGDPIHVDLALDDYRIGVASVASTRDDHGLDPVPEGQRAAVVLWTDDTGAAYAELTAAGAPALAPPHEWLGRLLIAWVADPDGNPVQLVQHVDAPPD
ncbi:VOC family protein [Plantactinospora sp. WMMB334]|uniref:VOC family protein n=1 Tax=Plantactinospora sp. WMMB334 TaxID=3404119 RepID=UPI003B944C78